MSKIVTSHQIEGYIAAHHKLVVSKEDATVYRGRKIHSSPNKCWSWEAIEDARNKLRDGGCDFVSGFNEKDEYEIHWWEAEVVLKEEA